MHVEAWLRSSGILILGDTLGFISHSRGVSTLICHHTLKSLLICEVSTDIFVSPRLLPHHLSVVLRRTRAKPNLWIFFARLGDVGETQVVCKFCKAPKFRIDS